MSTLEPWETIDSREVFVAEPWIRVSAERVRLPDGRVVDDYHQIRLMDFAMVFAQTADERVILERQYKHGLGKVTLTLPAGAIECGEQALAAAKRELLEETGYRAKEWQSMGAFVVSGNYGVSTAHMFLARQARLVAEPDSGDLEDMEIVLMSTAEIAEALRQGQVELISTVAAIALATSPLFGGGQDGRRRVKRGGLT
jgi:ADP-ribose pyrophosphatase